MWTVTVCTTCCRRATDTEVFAAAPPEYWAAFLLRLWDSWAHLSTPPWIVHLSDLIIIHYLVCGVFCVLLREIWLYNLVLHNDTFILTLESWMQIYQQPWMHHKDGRQSIEAAAVCSCLLTSKQSNVVSDTITWILNILCLRQMSGPWSCSHWITDCAFSGGLK